MILTKYQSSSQNSSDKEEFVLYHNLNDLSTNNILVDPITHVSSIENASHYSQHGKHGSRLSSSVVPKSMPSFTRGTDILGITRLFGTNAITTSLFTHTGQEKLKRIFENKVPEVEVRWRSVV
jgi:hypothetical protein